MKSHKLLSCSDLCEAKLKATLSRHIFDFGRQINGHFVLALPLALGIEKVKILYVTEELCTKTSK